MNGGGHPERIFVKYVLKDSNVNIPREYLLLPLTLFLVALAYSGPFAGRIFYLSESNG